VGQAGKIKGEYSNMPLFMDRHYVEGATRKTVAQAHQRDLAVQEKYQVQFLTYWFDEPRSTAFCLIISPDKETLQKAHKEAHGLVPNEILEVDPRIVEAFLGRVKDPTPMDRSPGSGIEFLIDSAFRAIMFTDLKDSTLMTTMLGDTKALHLLHIHNAITRNALRDHQGREIKHTGDGVMAAFDSVPAAVECAIQIQKSFMAHNQANPEETMYLRIGISAGEPIEDQGDLFGAAVNQAARICAHAEPSQILVAQVVRDLCPGKEQLFFDIGDITPKGFDRSIQVYEARWASETEHAVGTERFS
jgi:class 3 adenylate cyclase